MDTRNLADRPAPVRQGEELDVEGLQAFLQAQLPERADASLEVLQFPSGHSNLTYLLRLGEYELVLRRPPFGAKIKTAHDMQREYQILSTLYPVYPKVPRPLVYSEDASIIGAPFYLMERLKGIILRGVQPKGLELTAEQMRSLSENFVDNLVEIHQLDYEAAGLGELGHPEGYVQRQIEGWTKRYFNARTDDLPEIEQVAAWLADHKLPGSGAALIHNDYKYDNLVLDPDDPARIAGVLDWEMATIGDPLMDLGTSLGYWVEANDPPEMQAMSFGLTALPGNLDRRELSERYAQKRGLELSELTFYYVYGLFKIAVIVQQIYARYKAGYSQDPRFATLIFAVGGLGRAALQAIEKDARPTQTPESRALGYASLAAGAAARIPDVPDDTPTRPIEKVAIIGGGTMGAGISMNFLDAGLPVTLLEISPDALDKAAANIRKSYERSVQKGKLAPDQLEGRMSLLKPTLSYEEIKDADLVIEAVFEEMGVKEGVFKRLDRAAKPGAILATNTSTLDVNQIAGFTTRPQDVVGTHFFSPAHRMKLLEVVRGDQTAKDVLATVMQVARAIHKIPVISGVCDGFIGNRMIEQYSRQALFLLEEGALPQQVDSALEEFGFAMGAFRVADLAGNDISWAIRKRRYVEKPQVRYSGLADRLCESGRFGQKTGLGWYRYEPEAHQAIPDPEVEALIAAYRQETGIQPRPIGDDEIVGRCVLALVNEGARLLEEGIAQRASDIDVVYLTGYGFPADRGGPMFYADTLGLPNVVQAMKGFAQNPRADPDFWEPAPLLARLAEAGKTFTT